MNSRDPLARVPNILPHFHRRDRGLYFLVSKRPFLELSSEEALLYDSIDGCKTVSELAAKHKGAADILSRWREAGVVELITPLVAPERPHLVVIDPHMDDAALSAGGRLLHRRGRNRITILSVVKWSNATAGLWTKRDFINVDDVTGLRLKESALAVKVMGAGHRHLDWTDAPLRFRPPDLWSATTVEKFVKFPQPFFMLFPNPAEVSLLAVRLRRELEILRPDELWIPMGLGPHVDHALTRSACLMMLAQAPDRFENIPVAAYEDFPYAPEAEGHGAQIRTALAQCGASLVRNVEDITDVFEEKLRLISLYASQVKLSQMETALREFAERTGGEPGKLVEAYHCLDWRGRLPRESRLSCNWAGLDALRAGLASFLTRREKFRKVTVIALPSGFLGRWRTDVESLHKAFPNGALTVYAAEDTAWQIERDPEDKVDVKIIRCGWRGWAEVIRDNLLRFGSPTIVLWRGAYGISPGCGFMPFLKKMAIKLVHFFIRSILAFRPVVFAKTLADFCGVLNERLETSADPSLQTASDRN